MPVEPSPTYRWRRRRVPYTRVTWVGLVAVLLMLIHKRLGQAVPLSMGLTVLSFIGIVVLPTLAVILWRAGLLPPERVRVEGGAVQQAEPPSAE